MQKLLPGIFILVSIIFGPNIAHADDPCSMLDDIQARLETKDGFLRTVSLIASRIHSLISLPYYSELSEEEKGIYFTRQTGFYFTLDCSNPDENHRVEKIGLFGVGDKFKPLKKRNFSGETYYFGVMRSGLIALVRKHDLRKFKPDTVYLFNRMETTNFCTNKNQCSGARKEFNPRFHYATISPIDFKHDAVSDGCGPLNVTIYNGSKSINSRSGKPGYEYKNAQLEYCPKTKDNGVVESDLKSASAVFAELPVTGQFVILSSKKLREKIPFMFSQKKCGTNRTVKKKSVFTLGKSVNAGLDFQFIKAGINGSAKVEFDVSEEEVFDNDKQYLYLNYTIDPANNSVLQDHKKMINDIAITQSCEGRSIPKELNEVRINVMPEQNRVISIDIKDLHEKAMDAFKGVWITASSSSRMKGRAWLIAGFKQKEEWRNFIFSQMFKEIPGAIPRDIDREQRLYFADFFADLFMASAFEYVSKDEVESVEILTRF